MSEVEWTSRLSSLPPWQPPQTHTLVLSPHPDDETLAAGGLIASLRAQRVPVAVIAVTDGEHAYPDFPGLAAQREQEQTAALAQLGVSPECIKRLRLPDSDVAAHEARLVQALASHVTPSTHIIAPWPHDFHPDHEATGRAAASVANAIGARLTFWFWWTWHHADPALLSGLPLAAFPLDAQAAQAKKLALNCHRSQLEHPSGSPILPPDLLAPARRLYEIFLPA